jgi:hypothetical protein
MRAAALLLMTLTLAACSDVSWQKPGGDESGLAQDLGACNKLAQEKMDRMWGVAPVPRSDMSPVFGPTGPSPADRRLQQSQAVTVCMREKGYTLAPVAK